MWRLVITTIFIVFIITGCFKAKEEFNSTKPIQDTIFQKVENNDTVHTKIVQKGDTKTQIEPETKRKQIPLQKEAKTFLLLGVDSRGEEKSRSDAIMVVKYNPQVQEIKVASLMRDSYVKIPNHPNSKLNHAYFFGGKDLLKQTVSENFDIDVDHVVVIDFQGFTEIIDLIAPNGVEVNVTQEMIDDMKLTIKPGVQRLHGEQILSYVRFRHDGQSDFGRVERQQEVLLALKNSALEQFSTLDGIMKLPSFIATSSQFIETDMKTGELLKLAATIMMKPAKNIDTIRIPVDNSFENRYVDHAGAVLWLDIDENLSALQDFFNSNATDSPKEPL